ncbi:MAG: glycosyltransferase [Opitutaceae bacterium]|nr:glycosyltransferase [Opitutaceae bacterium]
MEFPEVSFIIPVFNRLDLTRDFVARLPATLPAGLRWEAVIIDDASSDGTAEFLAPLAPPFRALRQEINGGFARAANRGAAAASPTATVLGLLNNDLILAPGWLEPMLHLLAATPRVGAVGNVQVNPATGLVDHAGVFFDLEGLPTHAHKHRRRPPRGPWRARNAATAACLLVDRAAWDRLGGLHEGYRNGMEDIDLCVRLRREGLRILVSHESIVGHLVSSSPGRHDANDANTALFRQRCAATAARWGREEWAGEYFRRYARRWWRMDPARAWLALRLIVGLPVPRRFRPKPENPVA